MARHKLLLALPVLFGALAAVPASANQQYSYTGHSFTFATSPFSTSDHVSITLEFAAPLAAGLTLGTVTPLSFSFTDGHQTLTSFSFGGTLQIATDGFGAISAWDLEVCGNVGCAEVIVSRNFAGNVRDDGQLVPQGISEALVDNNPGTWVSTAIPEPGTLSLGATMLFGLGMLRRLRRTVSGNSRPA